MQSFIQKFVLLISNPVEKCYFSLLPKVGCKCNLKFRYTQINTIKKNNVTLRQFFT